MKLAFLYAQRNTGKNAGGNISQNKEEKRRIEKRRIGKK